MKSTMTTMEAARELGVADWRIRRLVDALQLGLERAGTYRLIPRTLLPLIERELRERGYLAEAAEAGR